MADLKKCGAVWLNESKAGKKYFSGSVEETIEAGSKIKLFKNTKYEEGGKHPYYDISVEVEEGFKPDLEKQDPELPF